MEISDGTSTTEYLYNGENRLIAVQPSNPVDGDIIVEFTYDYMGRRVKKEVYMYSSGSWLLNSDSLFLYNGWNLISEWSTSGPQSSKNYYVWGLDLSQTIQGAGGVGGLIASFNTLAGDFEKDGDVDGADLAALANDPNLLDLASFAANFGQTAGFSGSPGSSSCNYFQYYCYDGNGNVGQLVNAQNGNLAAYYEYDPYGNVIAAYGDMADDNPYRFSTKGDGN